MPSDAMAPHAMPRSQLYVVPWRKALGLRRAASDTPPPFCPSAGFLRMYGEGPEMVNDD